MESNRNTPSRIWVTLTGLAACGLILLSSPPTGAAKQAAAMPKAPDVSGPVKVIKIFNGEKRLFACYGPSTSMGYPARLQRKFYRYTDKEVSDSVGVVVKAPQ